MHLPSYKEAKTTDKREYQEKNYKLKEEYKKMIDAMPDDEFIAYMSFISGMNDMCEDDYEEMWADDEGWEDEAAKFYGYDNNDEDLPF